MSTPTLIMFMGCEGSGIYQYANIFKKMGLPCGMPYAFLRSSLAARRMPPHESHSYYSAIRRFFGDMGLPPIAEVPQDRISGSEFEYYSTLFCRCLLPRLKERSYLCADHLGSLALPIFHRAAEIGGFAYKVYFFFTNPEHEAVSLLAKYGQVPKLSEFIWRNSVVSAIRHCGENIVYVDTENMDMELFAHFKNEILAFWGMSGQQAGTDIHVPVIPTAIAPQGQIKLSRRTMDLYEALKAHNHAGLREMADNLYSLQREQNGWQYADCLDCGEIDQHARLLLNEDSTKLDNFFGEDEQFFAEALQNDETAKLLEISERRLVDARNDFAGKLFLHTSSLNAYCQHLLDDKAAVDCLEKSAIQNKTGRKCRKKIHKPQHARHFRVARK